MVPTGIIGLGFKDIIESLFKSPQFAAGGLIFTSVILFLSEKIRRGDRLITKTRWYDAIFIGFMQGIAIIPGISRSGSTIAAGLFAGMSRDAAARFSFILSIPAILGATVLHIKDFTAIEPQAVLPFIIGAGAAMVSGYIAIGTLMLILQRGRLYGFSIYTMVIGILGIIFLPR